MNGTTPGQVCLVFILESARALLCLYAVYVVDDLAKLCLYKRGVYIVLYADDILLLAPSDGELHNLLATGEVELDLIDMAINIKKSCCMRIGPRNHVCCASISCASGILLLSQKVIQF